MKDGSLRSAGAGLAINAELTLRELRVFVAVEETGSVGGAAERIGGSPSGVSQQISALEAALGVKLFDRRARPVTLTPAGQVLRVHARRILDAVSEARAELAELSLSSLPQLTLGMIDDLDASLTPQLVLILQDRFRGCFVNALSGRSDWITEKLERREADIAVSATLPKDSNHYRAIPILRESLMLITAKGLLKGREDIRAALTELPFVQYSEAMPIGRIIAQHLKRVRFNVPRRFSFEASRSVFAMLVQARGWSLTTPLNLLDAERFVPDVDVLRLPFPAISRTVQLIARTEELGRLPERLAVDCRRLVAQRIIPRFAGIAPHLSDAIEIPAD